MLQALAIIQAELRGFLNPLVEPFNLCFRRAGKRLEPLHARVEFGNRLEHRTNILGAVQMHIETNGLTVKEVRELETVLRASTGVEEARLTPFSPGLPPKHLPGLQANVAQVLHLLFRVADGAALGVGATASTHLYRKMGEAAVDKVWAAVALKLSGKSSNAVGVTLYGPDGKVIKDLRGHR